MVEGGQEPSAWQKVDVAVSGALRLTASEREAVYPGMAELVGNRRRRVGKRAKIGGQDE